MILAAAISITYLNISTTVEVSKILPYQYGYISLGISLPILLGVFISAPFGVRTAHITKPSVLRFIFGLVMLVIILKTTLSLTGFFV